MTKKILAVFLALAMVFSLAACSVASTDVYKKATGLATDGVNAIPTTEEENTLLVSLRSVGGKLVPSMKFESDAIAYVYAGSGLEAAVANYKTTVLKDYKHTYFDKIAEGGFFQFLENLKKAEEQTSLNPGAAGEGETLDFDLSKISSYLDGECDLYYSVETVEQETTILGKIEAFIKQIIGGIFPAAKTLLEIDNITEGMLLLRGQLTFKEDASPMEILLVIPNVKEATTSMNSILSFLNIDLSKFIKTEK